MLVKCLVTVKNDNGKAILSVYADSLEQARQKVITAENCPQCAILSVKVAPYTIYDIKHAIQQDAPYFFSRNTMRFFGQTLKDFSVTRYGNDKFYISARQQHGKTERYFNPFTGKLSLNAD